MHTKVIIISLMTTICSFLITKGMHQFERTTSRFEQIEQLKEVCRCLIQDNNDNLRTFNSYVTENSHLKKELGLFGSEEFESYRLNIDNETQCNNDLVEATITIENLKQLYAILLEKRNINLDKLNRIISENAYLKNKKFFQL